MEDVLFRPLARPFWPLVLAIVFSVLLHILLLLQFPSLPVGRPGEHAEQTDYASLRVDEVNMHEQRSQLDMPNRLSMQNPEDLLQLVQGKEDFEQPFSPKEPLPDMAPPAGEEQAIAEESPIPDATLWQARQEIIQVEQERWSEELARLPRRFIQDTERIVNAPDVALPTDGQGDETAHRLNKNWARLAPGLSTGVPGGLSPNGGEGLQPQANDLLEKSRLLDEKPETLTDVVPVEQFLNLKVNSYADAADGYRYFEVDVSSAGEDVLPVQARSVVFMLDCSESMTRSKLERCKTGLLKALDTLNKQDQFNIMIFRTSAELCFENWAQVTPLTRAAASGFIQALDPRGRTDVYASLELLLNIIPQAEHPVTALLVTDGRPTQGMVDSSQIIDTFTVNNHGRASVFALGGGTRVNPFLLDFLSYGNRGDVLVVSDRNELPGAISAMSEGLQRLVLYNLSYRFPEGDAVEVYPANLTHLYADRSLRLIGRCPIDVEQTAFRIVGYSGSERRDMVFPIVWSSTQPADKGLATRWAWQRMYDLIAQHIRSGDDQLVREIHALAAKHGLEVPYERDLK